MISIIIMAFKEPTIGRCIKSIVNQKINENYELVISAPDKETRDIAEKYAKKYRQIKLFKDPGKGKNYAINMLYPSLKGRILVFTDGDVYLSDNSINEILKEFEKKDVSCVTGRPVPQESKKNKYGFWANFLFDSAHLLRKKQREKNGFLETSGYLYSYKNNIISQIPLAIADDLIIPSLFWEKGFKIGYAEKAFVFVKNADNWEDWLKQKIRTTKSHLDLDRYVDVSKIKKTKTFFNEARGIFYLFSYPKSFKEFFWIFQLVFARLYMWFMVLFETRIKHKNYGDGWERVESTKIIA